MRIVVPVIFLALVLLGLLIATWQDIKIREVPDTVSIGLIVLGLLGGLVIALVTRDVWFFLERLVGFCLGLLIGLIMYYTRQWGGGDAKLIMGVCAVLGLSLQNVTALAFVVLLVLSGAAYGIATLAYLSLFTHRAKFVPACKVFLRTPKIHRMRIALVTIEILLVVAVFFVPLEQKLVLGFVMIALYLFVYLYIFSRVIEKTVLLKDYPVAKLTEGDWVAKDVKVGNKLLVSAKTTGITKQQISQLKKAHVCSVLVREGIAFVPAFLIAFLLLLVLQHWMPGWLAMFVR